MIEVTHSFEYTLVNINASSLVIIVPTSNNNKKTDTLFLISI